MEYANSFTLIIGLGKSGVSVADFCASRNIPFAINDTRAEPPGLADIKKKYPNAVMQLGGLSQELLDAAEEIIISPGLSIKEPLIAEQIAKGKRVVGDVEVFLRYCKAPICAITGANAKSTVTSLVYEMAKCAGLNAKIGGNIGVPVLQLLEGTDPELYVLELSSFQLETTFSLQAKAATILNISSDHMDRYETLAEYISAKQKVYQHCQTAVFNRGDENTYVQVAKPQNELSFGLDWSPTNMYGLLSEGDKTYLARGREPLMNVKELPVSGLHYCENALAALALGEACELPITAMLEALRTFKGLPHRCQLVKATKGVQWFNDSKGTNEGAAKAAIDSIGKTIAGKVLLIAGGIGKGADFETLKTPVKNYVSHAILLGEASNQLANVFNGLTEIHQVISLKDAVILAHQLSQSGDAVLLSPACASFDMFQNFEKRGEAFVDAVQEIVK